MSDSNDLLKQLNVLQKQYEELVSGSTTRTDRIAEAIERLLEKKFPSANRRPMPTQGSAEAPVLKKVNSTEGKAFLTKFERCLREADIDDDATVKEYLIEYLPEDIAKFMKTSKRWADCTYLEAKETLMDALGDGKEERQYKAADLTVLVRKQALTSPESLEDLQRRTISFNAIANYLVEKGSLTEEIKAKMYLLSFHPAMRSSVVDHIRRKEPERDKEKPFGMELIYKSAKYVVVPWFFEDESSVSASISQHAPIRRHEEVREEPKKYSPSVKSPQGNQNIDELVDQLEKMTIHDQAYAVIYNVVVSARPSMEKYLSPPAFEYTTRHKSVSMIDKESAKQIRDTYLNIADTEYAHDENEQYITGNRSWEEEPVISSLSATIEPKNVPFNAGYSQTMLSSQFSRILPPSRIERSPSSNLVPSTFLSAYAALSIGPDVLEAKESAKFVEIGEEAHHSSSARKSVATKGLSIEGTYQAKFDCLDVQNEEKSESGVEASTDDVRTAWDWAEGLTIGQGDEKKERTSERMSLVFASTAPLEEIGQKSTAAQMVFADEKNGERQPVLEESDEKEEEDAYLATGLDATMEEVVAEKEDESMPGANGSAYYKQETTENDLEEEFLVPESIFPIGNDVPREENPPLSTKRPPASGLSNAIQSLPTPPNSPIDDDRAQRDFKNVTAARTSQNATKPQVYYQEQLEASSHARNQSEMHIPQELVSNLTLASSIVAQRAYNSSNRVVESKYNQLFETIAATNTTHLERPPGLTTKATSNATIVDYRPKEASADGLKELQAYKTTRRDAGLADFEAAVGDFVFGSILSGEYGEREGFSQYIAESEHIIEGSTRFDNDDILDSSLSKSEESQMVCKIDLDPNATCQHVYQPTSPHSTSPIDIDKAYQREGSKLSQRGPSATIRLDSKTLIEATPTPHHIPLILSPKLPLFVTESRIRSQ